MTSRPSPRGCASFHIVACMSWKSWLALRRQDGLFDPLNRLIYWLVFPDSNHYPAVLFEDRGMTMVPLDVLGDLRLPIRAIRCRKRAVLGTAMPEATVDEYSHLSTREDEVGSNTPALAWFDREVDPIPETRSVGGFANRQLRPSIPTAVRPHDLASGFWDIAP